MAAVYSAFIALFVHRDMGFRDVPHVMLNAAKMTSMLMFIIACAMIFAHTLTEEQIPQTLAAKVVEAATSGLKPSVIWLHFQECTGCTESLLRTSHPELAELILDLISLDYHETLSAAAGHQVENLHRRTPGSRA